MLSLKIKRIAQKVSVLDACPKEIGMVSIVVLALKALTKRWLHTLVHSHASLLISKLGAQPKLVADRLGHEKIQTTLATYSHLYPDQARDLADQLNNLMNGFDEKEEDSSAGEA